MFNAWKRGLDNLLSLFAIFALLTTGEAELEIERKGL